MNGRILLVDDEKALLPLLERYLGRAGYSVTACLDAESALAFSSEPDWRADAVVADLTLPGMSGLDLAVELLQRHPTLVGLLCSGYPLAPEMVPADIRPRMAMLQKPFLPAMLAEAVASLLASRQA